MNRPWWWIKRPPADTRTTGEPGPGRVLVATGWDTDGEPDSWAYVPAEIADTYRREGWSSTPGGDSEQDDYWTRDYVYRWTRYYDDLG